MFWGGPLWSLAPFLLLRVLRWKEDLSQTSLDSNGLPFSLFSIAEIEAPEVQDRLVYCYPVRLAIPSPPLPSVEMHMENNVACVRYKGEMVKVSRNYFSKLVRADCQSCVTCHKPLFSGRFHFSLSSERRGCAEGGSADLAEAVGHCPNSSRKEDSYFHLSQGQASAGNTYEVWHVCFGYVLCCKNGRTRSKAALAERHLPAWYVHSCW